MQKKSNTQQDSNLRVKEVCELLSVSSHMIYVRVFKNQIPFYKCPKTSFLFFKKMDIIKWVLSTRVNNRFNFYFPNEEITKFIRINEVSKMLGVETWEVRNIIKYGDLPCYRPIKNFLFVPEEISEWIKRNQLIHHNDIKENRRGM